MTEEQARALAIVARLQGEHPNTMGKPLAADEALDKAGIDRNTLDELRTDGFVDYAELSLHQWAMVTGYRLTPRGWDSVYRALLTEVRAEKYGYPRVDEEGGE